jgi:hypothetical protein
MLPIRGRRYVVGADPAEGNPTSEQSALEVLDVDSGEEAASLAGRFEPATLAAHAATVACYYNGAAVMVERYNHGHAVLLWLLDHARDLVRLCGEDKKPGWNTTTKSKAMLYDRAGEALRDRAAVIHSPDTFAQLASIEGSTDRAPEGQPDDRAVAFVLALTGCARVQRMYPSSPEMQGPCLLTPGWTSDPILDCFGPNVGIPRGQTGALGYGAEGGPPGWG